jgi:hypothetical protein
MGAQPGPIRPLDAARTGPQQLAESVLARVRPLTDRLVLTILESNPGYRAANVVPEDDLWQSCHDNVTRVLQLLVAASRAGGLPDDERLYDAARATGHRRAGQGLPLDDVLRSFRLGGRLIWDALTDQARAQGTVDSDALLEIGGRVWEVVDSTSAQVAAAYHATERELLRADEQRKVGLWEGLLAGRGKDATFAFEAARILGLPKDGQYVVLVAEPPRDFLAFTRTMTDRLAGRGVPSAWHSRAALLIGILAVDAARLELALDLLRNSREVPIGVSLLLPGLAEVEQGHRQATLALRLLDGRPNGVAALSDRMPEALLLGSPELAERLVQIWLGPVLALPAGQRGPLLDTLEAWVATGGSTSHTAEVVHCHRNTVINRMHRLAAVTGRDLFAVPIPVELPLALRARRLSEPLTVHGAQLRVANRGQTAHGGGA